MEREWEIDVSVSDIGSIFTLLGIAVTSAVIGAAEIAYTMLWITSAYERNGKDFFLDLLYATSYTWTAQYVIVAGSVILVSAIIFLLTMSISLVYLNHISTKKRRPNLNPLFGLYFLGLSLLIVTLLSAIMLRYS
ncbi:MAG: Ribonuclease BN [Methanothrix sp.]|nr:MAG: Ribonuclease BN [Methanothrix sp.]